MIIQGPPTPPGAVAQSVSFDLVAHTFTITYSITGALPKTIQGNIPAGFLTQLGSAVQRQIEADQGWANGSSTVVTP